MAQAAVHRLATSPSAIQIPRPPNPGTEAIPPQPVLVLESNDGITSFQALRQRFSTTDPKYAFSFGTVAFERSPEAGFKITGWRVIDLVQRIWERLEILLGDLIVEKRDRWES